MIESDIDAIVVKEKFALTPPVLEDRIDELERKALVVVWVGEKKAGNEPLCRKSRTYVAQSKATAAPPNP